jgi:nicotinate-nucleotide pyrophosphorylase (carboxylating)
MFLGVHNPILKAERMVLNSMQRMSAIATKLIIMYKLKLLEQKTRYSRKRTPGFRVASEKWAVTIGGG